jgi:hypothetical protein
LLFDSVAEVRLALSGGKDWVNFAVAITVKDDSNLCCHPRTVTGENLNLREEQLEVPNTNHPQYKFAV